MAHTCNTGYLEDWDQEDRSSKSAHIKKVCEIQSQWENTGCVPGIVTIAGTVKWEDDSPAQPQQKQNPQNKKRWCLAQVVVHLLSKYQILNSSPNLAKNK
jgi:hypothetical protein